MIFDNYVDAFYVLKDKLKNKEIINGTVEICDIRINIPHSIKFVDLPIKKADRTYIDEEIKWYFSTSKNINDNKRIASTKIWQQVATKDGFVNSNYGYRILTEENGSQLQNAIQALLDDQYSRQSIMYYAYPHIHQDKNDGIHANNDMICTSYVQCLIRDNKLFYMVYMRSNDAFYGFQNDYSWHRCIHSSIYHKLLNKYPDLQFGDIIWHAGSFHVYERHFKLLESLPEKV